MRRKSDNKILNLFEICEVGLHDAALMSTSSKDLFEEKGVFVEENTEQDILEIFKDFFNYINKSFNSEDEKLIQKYKEIRLEINSKYNVLPCVNNFIAPSFLRSYPNLIQIK